MSILAPSQKFILKRVSWYLLTFFIAITINFIIPHLRSASPIDTIINKTNLYGLSDSEISEKKRELNKDFGLDKPIFSQYISYLKSIVTLDFGYSISKYPNDVWSILKGTLFWTAILQIPVVIFGVIFGNFIGVLAGYKRGVYDKIFYPISLIFSSTPYFAMALILVYIFSITFEWFPAIGAYSDLVDPSFTFSFIISSIYHYILPFLSLFIVFVGSQAVSMRTLTIKELSEDYIEYAKYSGMGDKTIISYLFRNALPVQLANITLTLGVMIAGTILVEMIFSYPGIGSTLFSAIRANDYPVIQAGTLIIIFNLMLLNLFSDIATMIIDPRLRRESEL